MQQPLVPQKRQRTQESDLSNKTKGQQHKDYMEKRTQHSRKYDRQIRLWGVHGQRSIESSHTVVLGSGALASETLKNLVLPNMGEFTVVDDAVTSPVDLSNNFFVCDDDLDKPRAEAVCAALLEMNPDASGKAFAKSPLALIESELAFFDEATLVVACEMWGAPLRRLADYLFKRHIPLLVARTNGLIGQVRLCVPEHTVIESHGDGDRKDLCVDAKRLAEFDELRAFCDRFSINSDASDYEHAHVPMLVILAKVSQEWHQQHGGKPSTAEEKEEFKRLIKRYRRSDAELNFDEALANAYKVWAPPVDFAVTDVLSRAVDKVAAIDGSTTGETLPSQHDLFWLQALALRRFQEAHDGLLPVSADIPDMQCDTQTYLSLKKVPTPVPPCYIHINLCFAKVFAERAKRDCAQFLLLVQQVLQERNLPASALSEQDMRHFFKHHRFLQASDYTSLDSEYASGKVDLDDIGTWDGRDANEDTGMPVVPHTSDWYAALRVAELFFEREGRLPGSEDAKYQEDLKKVSALARECSQHWDCEVSDDCVRELCRYGGAQLHNIGALLGGVTSQAALKLVTRQYIPLNNCFLFNGIHGIAATLRL
ncbi:MAG: hypothetical protein MHM6MM_002835 [Cercozoa sp. M6MM]